MSFENSDKRVKRQPDRYRIMDRIGGVREWQKAIVDDSDQTVWEGPEDFFSGKMLLICSI